MKFNDLLQEKDLSGGLQFNYDYIVSMVRMLNNFGQGADIKFSANNSILILGAIGSPKFAAKHFIPYRGGKGVYLDGNRDKIVVFPTRRDGVEGLFYPDSGEIQLAQDVMERFFNGVPTVFDADTLVHELLHRGFSVLHMMHKRGFIKNLPQDLTGTWRGGWGAIQSGGPWIRAAESAGLSSQQTAEHAMIYATSPGLASSTGYVSKYVINMSARHPVARRFFSDDFMSTFNDRYDDMTQNRVPETVEQKYVTYWRILFAETSRAARDFLINQVGDTASHYTRSSPTPPPSRPNNVRGRTVEEKIQLVKRLIASTTDSTQRKRLLQLLAALQQQQ